METQRKKPDIKHLFLCMVVLWIGLASCSYDSDDNNYTHVEKPKETG